mgnify:CR=1 FL=1
MENIKKEIKMFCREYPIFAKTFKQCVRRYKKLGKKLGETAYLDTLDRPEESAREIRMKERRDNTSCSHCPPNRGENAKRKSKHGTKKPRKVRR